jgi:hypothetical protein
VVAAPRSPQRATLPACIRVVDAPFQIVISAPSLELGNPFAVAGDLISHDDELADGYGSPVSTLDS